MTEKVTEMISSGPEYPDQNTGSKYSPTHQNSSQDVFIYAYSHNASEMKFARLMRAGKHARLDPARTGSRDGSVFVRTVE